MALCYEEVEARFEIENYFLEKQMNKGTKYNLETVDLYKPKE